MTRISFDKKFEYEIEKQGQLYVAGIKKVRLNLNNESKLSGNLYLDKLNKRTIEKYKYCLAQPIFRTSNYTPWYKYTKEERENIFSVKNVVIAKSLDQFVENIKLGLIKEEEKDKFLFKRVSIKNIEEEKSLDQFVENIKLELIKLREEYTQKIQSKNIIYFFEKIHQHYENIVEYLHNKSSR